MRHGISAATGLPRFVIRINAGGKTYFYFRHAATRVRLPAIDDVAFAGTYAALLLQHGLATAAALPARPTRSIKRREVYFIEDAERGAIKIGVARWPKSRLQLLQVGASRPLALIATIAGEEETERAWHSRFAHLRLRGEWFRDAPELRQAIDQAAA
jgi:hypothetical protein